MRPNRPSACDELKRNAIAALVMLSVIALGAIVVEMVTDDPASRSNRARNCLRAARLLLPSQCAGPPL